MSNTSSAPSATTSGPSSFTVVSTFAGCGGSSLGYQWAGGKVLCAIEWDDNAVQTYRLNFPDTPVLHRDIATVSVDDVLEVTGLAPGELDILDGSPPCQGFSTAGKRILDDPRNSLFCEFVRLLEGLRPRVFVMENVSGMVKGKMKLVFAEIMRALKSAGYRVSARMLNAMYFGVPQSRQRMIFVGLRKGLAGDPTHPTAQTAPISVRVALAGLCQATGDVSPAELRKTWQMYRVLTGQEAKKHFGLVVSRWDHPAPTIVKDAGNTSTGIIHPGRTRRFTIPELRRLSTFPDGYALVGTYKEQWARIGNSVPPRFMQAIAEHVRDEILAKATRESDGMEFPQEGEDDESET
jgi:DNA (cytosine-5)-methyltransferase 1